MQTLGEPLPPVSQERPSDTLAVLIPSQPPSECVSSSPDVEWTAPLLSPSGDSVLHPEQQGGAFRVETNQRPEGESEIKL